MKRITFTLALAGALIFASCGGNAENGNENINEGSANDALDTLATLEGTWNVHSIDSERYQLSDCEKNMNFNFTSAEGEQVSGIATRVLEVTQGEENPCDLTGPNDNYNTTYTLANGMLYVKSFRMDQKQMSGMMKIDIIDDNNISLTSMKHTFFLKRK